MTNGSRGMVAVKWGENQFSLIPNNKSRHKICQRQSQPPEPARSEVSIFKYGPASALSVLNCPRQLNCIIADATTEPDGAKLSKFGLLTAPCTSFDVCCKGF